MTEVLCFWHRGFPCAVPSEQAVSVGPVERVEAGLEMWATPLGPAREADSRGVLLQTSTGPRWVLASHLRVLDLSEDQVRRLSPALRSAIACPQVVGLATLADDLVWLVDATRIVPDEN